MKTWHVMWEDGHSSTYHARNIVGAVSQAFMQDQNAGRLIVGVWQTENDWVGRLARPSRPPEEI